MKFLPTTIFVMQTIHVKNQTCTYIRRVHVIWISYMAKTKVHHQLLAFSTTLCQMCFTFYKILLIFTIIKRGRTKNKNINAINPLIITLWSKWQLLVIKLKSKFFVKKKNWKLEGKTMTLAALFLLLKCGSEGLRVWYDYNILKKIIINILPVYHNTNC